MVGNWNINIEFDTYRVFQKQYLYFSSLTKRNDEWLVIEFDTSSSMQSKIVCCHIISVTDNDVICILLVFQLFNLKKMTNGW